MVLPARVRRQLRLARGERLTIEVQGDSVVLRRVGERRRYKTARQTTSGLPVMVPLKPPARKVTAAEIARLNAEIL